MVVLVLFYLDVAVASDEALSFAQPSNPKVWPESQLRGSLHVRRLSDYPTRACSQDLCSEMSLATLYFVLRPSSTSARTVDGDWYTPSGTGADKIYLTSGGRAGMYSWLCVTQEGEFSFPVTWRNTKGQLTDVNGEAWKGVMAGTRGLRHDVLCPGVYSNSGESEDVTTTTTSAATATTTTTTATPRRSYHCANEGGICSCNDVVIFGKRFLSGKPGHGASTSLQDILDSTMYKAEPIHGSMECSNRGFRSLGMSHGDPAPGFYKHCYCGTSSSLQGALADDSAGAPLSPAAFGSMISAAAWQNEYDFVVKLRINKDGNVYGCTGIVWKARIITAAHCARKQDKSFVSPAAITAFTANRAFSISAMNVHPKYESDNADYMILTMSGATTNSQAIALKATDNIIGTRLMLAGMGVTATDDTNSLWPARPVLTAYMSTTACHWNEFTNCIASGPASRQSSCGADSGGPWLQWRGEIAVVAGVNSFGYAGGPCGDVNQMTGFAPTSVARDWIEQVAPGYFPWSDSTYLKLSTGSCPFDRQVSKAECLTAAKSIGAAAGKTQLDGGHDSGMRGRPHGCTLHEWGNVEWWGPSDNAPCGNLNYNCVCKMAQSRRLAKVDNSRQSNSSVVSV